MEIYCTRPGCPRPLNFFADLDDNNLVKTVQQKYCTACGMQLILDGRYLSAKLLGRGGFGAAFLARDRRTPGMRRCVVKQFQPVGDLTPDQLQIAQNLFAREGEVLEELGSHPQIPDLFAFFDITVPSIQPGKQDKFFYLVQEFIDGHNLEEELAQKGKFSPDEVLLLLREILPVLKFVHDSGSIHRDIKLSNIMRHRNGRLYLLDFGAVKQVTKATPGGSSTGIYSMGFAPPEQMAGGQVYPSTDLYALAVTCIILLTGKQATELFDVYTNQWNWRPHAGAIATAAVASEWNRFADILDQMLLSAPNQRFQSADEVLHALTSLLPSPAPLAPPTQMPTRVAAPAAPAAPPTPAPTPQPPAPISQPASRPRFSLLEVLGGAAFTGFEGGLLFIALGSLLPSPGLSVGLLGMMIGGLLFAQYRRFIEKLDLFIIAGITLAIMLFFPVLRDGFPLEIVVFVAMLAGAGAIAVTALFRLIYKLLANFL
ncbi:protein kinase [Trichocoleus sp. ST-U3]|uniref:serine/threonine-protein kinase n=1 Tax=Coleofasciculus sp. FACHB-542 TaxID=2692787 RepID=UPI001687DABD|nr:serine/threonine-protein kinase [Coleofasciculus sp. FACHB-542]MBD2084865.1 protein kinase [Coleofasciculus sp. FACHB-542]